MATLLHGESKRKYSWWWDSHISPKNSKWLQENLTDMDRNVKSMIKLIEEDADSFARRAEMYYKKRPELMKLVEEFYRAYRALAERYDHATGALRQAHRTMAEAFPNQIPPIMLDDSPSSSGAEIGPRTPEMPSPLRPPLDPDDLHKDTLGVSSHFHARRRNGSHAEENDLLSCKQGLKQLKEMFPSGEGPSRAKFTEGKVRKVLNFKEEGRVEEKEDIKNEVQRLQDEVSQLSTRNANLISQIALESQRARNLEGTIFKLDSVKEAALLQYRLSVERISSLETDFSKTRCELNNINDAMVAKLNSFEKQCLYLVDANKSLQLELETQQTKLEKKGKELEELNISMAVEHQKRMQAEMALMSLEQIHTYSQKEGELLVLEIQRGNEKLKDMELIKVDLEERISELMKIICNLNEQNKSFDVKVKDLQDEMKLLTETKEKIEYELGICLEENKALQEELCCVKEDRKDLELRHQRLTEQVDVVSEKNLVLENSISDANVELEGLREKTNALEASCETLLCEVSTHAVEKGVLVSQAEIMSQNMERLSEKSTLLEVSLSVANAELERLSARFKDLEECCMSLCDQNSFLLAEKNTLIFQMENLESKHLELQCQHFNLEKEHDSTMQQVTELQSSLKVIKHEHEAFIVSLSSQLASLHNRIYVLEEEVRIKSEDLEMEQQKVVNSLFEIFILKRCLCDMKDKSLNLFGECQNLLEASRCAEDKIFQLKHNELIQKKVINSLSEHNDVLAKGIRLLLEALSIDVNVTVDDITDEVILHRILGEIRNLLNSVSDVSNENRQLHFEVVNLENKYLMLQDQHTNLELEKDSTDHQVMKLESYLRLEKQEREACILSFSSQLASLQNQIHLQEEEIRTRDKDIEVEQQKTVDAHIENFVLQRCLCDMKDKGLYLSGEYHKIIEALGCTEKHLSELEHKELIQKKELTLLSNHSEIIRARINLLFEALGIDMKNTSMDSPTDGVLWQTILDEIKNLQNSISDAHDETQRLHLEVLVLGTLLKQGGLDKFHLHHELESKKKELLALVSEKHEVMEINGQLKAEKNFLISQVEIIGQSLEILEAKYSELEHRNFLLEKDKDLACHLVLELESSLKLEKQQHHTLFLLSKSKVASLETQIDLLQEKLLAKEDEVEREQQMAMSSFLENFILQGCLSDMKEVNLVLSEEYQKLLETSRCSAQLISELRHKRHIQEKEMMLISETNEKLRSGILLSLKELNMNKEHVPIDGAKAEVLIETLLGEIKTMLTFISNAWEETQRLHLEMSVLFTILKHACLEKNHLYYELAKQNEEVLFERNMKVEAMEINGQLRSEMQILCERLSQLHTSHQRSEAENCNLLEDNLSLSKKLYDLNQKTDALVAENSDVLAEALALDHLFVVFKSLSTQCVSELKLLSNNICCILAVKNGLDEEVRLQHERMKELELEIINLRDLAVLQDFELNMARNLCEESNCQIEAGENMLTKKDMVLFEANVENTELCRKLHGLNKDLDGAKMIIKELGEMIKSLSLRIASKDAKITHVLETNGFLRKDIDRLNCEVDILRRSEDYLSSELQKETTEVYKCEGDIQSLLNDIQISTLNAAIFEDKLLELIGACESLWTFSLSQKEMLHEEVVLKTASVDELTKKIGNLEGENGALKADLNVYSLLLMSLFDGVSCVEEHIRLLGNLRERQVDSALATLIMSSQETSENASIPSKRGILELQKLIAKVGELQKVIIDTKNHLEQERLEANASIGAARKEIEELRLLHEISKEKYGQTMKDIQLDQVSSSCISTYGGDKNGNTEPDDQMLELWETAERDEIEAVEEVKSEYPSSELIAEKELSIDKLEVCTRFKESPREWNKMFVDKLDSDAQRISALKGSVQELKAKLEGSDKKKHSKTAESATLKVQLRGAEEAILEQADIICKLKKKVEDNFESSSSVIWEKERRQVSEEARAGSERIGKLELELQKIEYIFLKVEEEAENRKTGCGDKKSSILLSEYIYGKNDGKGKRKGHLCRCMRPKTKG